ncbi:LOC105233496 [Sergentomyia squamirostris]
MESGSVLSEPSSAAFSANRALFAAPERTTSMTILSSGGTTTTAVPQAKPRMAHLETLEAKMASIEVSLSGSTPRRRKGTSLGGSSSVRSSPRPESAPATKEVRSALQDREAIIQSLRMQLGLGKLPRPCGTPLTEAERPAAEQRHHRLKIDAENKKIAIRNLKAALDKLDITDNIDVRIRQAELEYALGREELQLLSLVEEIQALQSRLEKSKPEANSIYNILQNGTNLSLHAVQVTVGRWAATSRTDCPGMWVEWALDGEGLYRGDRIIEVNGKILSGRTKEELQKLIGTSSRCQLVVIRQRSMPFAQQQLLQSQEDNMRLQHRISYLEEQVKELQETKESSSSPNSHVTSISISSPVPKIAEKPEIFQRGNFITTIVDGKPTKNPPVTPQIVKPAHVTKTTIIKDSGMVNGHHINGDDHRVSKNFSTSTVSLTSNVSSKRDHEEARRERYLQKSSGRIASCHAHHQQQQQISRSGDHLHEYSRSSNTDRKIESLSRKLNGHQNQPRTHDLRSVKSLDFDSDCGGQSRDVDYTSEPLGLKPLRPLPPKKPLRLSLQRAQSLQTVEGVLTDVKRASKRPHHRGMTPFNGDQPIHTSSLGRNKYI